jgi:hypothetical protein
MQLAENRKFGILGVSEECKFCESGHQRWEYVPGWDEEAEHSTDER